MWIGLFLYDYESATDNYQPTGSPDNKKAGDFENPLLLFVVGISGLA